MAIFIRTTDRIIRLPRPEHEIVEIILRPHRKNATIWAETESYEGRILIGDFPKEDARNVLQAIQNALTTRHIVVDARVEAHEVP
jgi:hypothetical protein